MRTVHRCRSPRMIRATLNIFHRISCPRHSPTNYEQYRSSSVTHQHKFHRPLKTRVQYCISDYKLSQLTTMGARRPLPLALALVTCLVSARAPQNSHGHVCPTQPVQRKHTHHPGHTQTHSERVWRQGPPSWNQRPGQNRGGTRGRVRTEAVSSLWKTQAGGAKNGN